MSGAVTKNLVKQFTYLLKQIGASGTLTADEVAAIHAANSPTAGNPVATMADIPPGGGDMLKSVYDPTSINASPFVRSNHTGTQLAATISDFATAADLRVAAGISTHVGLADPHPQYMLESVYDPTNIAASAFVRSNHTGTQTASTISDFNTAADARVSSGIAAHVALSDPHVQYQLRSELGAAGGYAPLDGSGKIDAAYLPDSIVGQVEFQGTWDANTNTPAIPPPDSTNKGWYYITTGSCTAGSGYPNVPAVDFQDGDWIISDGSTWTKVDNSDAVTTVFGRSGNVVAVAGDYTSTQITNSSTVSGTWTTDALDWLKNNRQPLDAELTALAGLTSAADALPYFTGSGTAAVTTMTSTARSLLDDTSVGAMRTTLGATAIGSNIFTVTSAAAIRYMRINADDSVTLLSAPTFLTAIGGQASDATLTSIAALGTAANKTIYTTGIDTWAETDLSSFGRSLIDDADATAARSTLGLGSAALLASSAVFQVANNLSEGTASTMRTNMGLGTLATQSGTFSGTHSGTSSGTNTGDQTISLTGDVTGSGTGSFAATVVSATGAFSRLGSIYPAQIVATQNDYAPTGFSTCSVIYVNTDADSRNITGLAGGSDGREVTFINNGSFKLIFSNENAGSTASNRFHSSASFSIPPDNGFVTFRYEAGTMNRWRPIAWNTAAGGDLSGSNYPTVTITTNAITYAKMQDVANTQRVIGRNTAGSGDPEEVTATQVLDWLGSTQGQVLYRGSASWTALAVGSPGQYLKTGGSAADVSWDYVNGIAAITSAPGAIANSETAIFSSASSMAANRLVAGSTVMVKLRGTFTSGTSPAAPIFRVRYGTNGTTADGQILSFTLATAPNSGTTIAFAVDILFTVRTTGGSATVDGTLSLVNNGTTGLSATATQVVRGSASTFNTATAATFFTITFISGFTNGSATFQDAVMKFDYK